MIPLANVNFRNGGWGAYDVVTEAGRPAGGYWKEMLVTWTWDLTGKIVSCWESRCDLKVEVTDFTDGLNVRMRKRKESKVIFGLWPNQLMM